MKKLSLAKTAAVCALFFAMPGIAEDLSEGGEGRKRSASSPAAIQMTLPASPAPSRVLEKPLVSSHSMFSQEAERQAFSRFPQGSIPFGFCPGGTFIPYPPRK